MLPRVTAALTGLLLGIGMGMLVGEGRWSAVGALVPLGLGLAALIRALIPVGDRRRVGAVVALAFALHVAIAVLLYTGSLALGRGGFIPGDDAEYYNVARHFMLYLQGRPEGAWIPPFWAGEAYIFGTWVYLETAIFLLVGPEVLVPILLNGAFALAMALLVFDMTRSLFERRAAFLALVLTAFYPSLVLWSSINLKDALALLIIALCLWALVRFHRRPRWWPLALALALLIPMESLRQYIFVGLATLIPLVVALTPGLSRLSRVRWTLPVATVSLLLLLSTQAQAYFSPQLLDVFQGEREAMGIGARTRFVEAPPVVVKEGDTFVVGGPTAPPTAAPSPAVGAVASTRPPTPAPSVVHVGPNARIVVVTAGPVPTAAPGVAYARPGDIVVVGPPGTTPRPAQERSVLPLGSTQSSLTFSAPVRPVDALVRRSISYAPVGLAFALFGPFPWLLTRKLDLLVLPEMLLWYVCLVGAVATLARTRARWQGLAPLALLSCGVLGVLSLVEGNWGTLFRHRAMAIPWVLALAAPFLLEFAVRRFHRPEPR